MARKQPPEPLGQVNPSPQAKRERKQTEEIQRDAALDNLTNVPVLPSAGGAASAPAVRSTKPKEYFIESVSPEVKILNVNGKAVLRFDGYEEWAQLVRTVRAAS